MHMSRVDYEQMIKLADTDEHRDGIKRMLEEWDSHGEFLADLVNNTIKANPTAFTEDYKPMTERMAILQSFDAIGNACEEAMKSLIDPACREIVRSLLYNVNKADYILTRMPEPDVKQ